MKGSMFEIIIAITVSISKPRNSRSTSAPLLPNLPNLICPWQPTFSPAWNSHLHFHLSKLNHLDQPAADSLIIYDMLDAVHIQVIVICWFIKLNIWSLFFLHERIHIQNPYRNNRIDIETYELEIDCGNSTSQISEILYSSDNRLYICMKLSPVFLPK